MKIERIDGRNLFDESPTPPAVLPEVELGWFRRIWRSITSSADEGHTAQEKATTANNLKRNAGPKPT